MLDELILGMDFWAQFKQRCRAGKRDCHWVPKARSLKSRHSNRKLQSGRRQRRTIREWFRLRDQVKRTRLQQQPGWPDTIDPENDAQSQRARGCTSTKRSRWLGSDNTSDVQPGATTASGAINKAVSGTAKKEPPRFEIFCSSDTWTTMRLYFCGSEAVYRWRYYISVNGRYHNSLRKRGGRSVKLQKEFKVSGLNINWEKCQIS